MDGAWTTAPLTNARLSTKFECMASQIGTPICVPAAQQLSTCDNNICVAYWAVQQ